MNQSSKRRQVHKRLEESILHRFVHFSGVAKIVVRNPGCAPLMARHEYLESFAGLGSVARGKLGLDLARELGIRCRRRGALAVALHTSLYAIRLLPPAVYCGTWERYSLQ